jgi:hypothetical protein
MARGACQAHIDPASERGSSFPFRRQDACHIVVPLLKIAKGMER